MKTIIRAGLAVMILVGALAPTVVGASPQATETMVHVVQWGENLTLIAAQYGTTVEAIATANGIANPDLVFVGQQLTISGAASSPVPATPSGDYVVQAGDTLTAIAWRHEVGLWELVQANGIANPSLIYVGQRLVIPGGSSGGQESTQSGVHVVQAGETLTAIAARYGTTVEAIAVANGIANPSLIYVGQRLTIPGAGAAPTPAPGPTMTPLPTSTPLPGATATPTSSPGATATPTPSATPSSYQYVLAGDPVGEVNAGVTQIRGKIWDAQGNPVNGVRVRVRTAGGDYDEISFASGPASGYPDGGYDMLLDSRAKDGNWLVAVCDAEGGLLSESVKVQTYADGPSVIYIDWRRAN